MGSRKRILVVDDDRGMVATLCDILELHGWETLRGYDGESAVSLAAQHDVDLLLMDIRMPRLDGIAAWRAIHSRQKRARAVLMTAHAQHDAARIEAEGEGVVRVLRKPLDLPELVALLDRVRLASRS
jgi:two-component system response regulator (stage 0 sporulation protein F)